MKKKSIPKGIVKDIIIVVIGVVAIWIGLQIAFGTANPFYVVSSGSMIPVLEVYDVLIVNGHVPFEDIKIGDVIVFNRPSGHDRVIVHRVTSILNDDPKTIRTRGDANPGSIPGTDFPITKEEYIGKVAYVVPQIGYVTQILRPPINYIIIVIVIGVMVLKQMMKKKTTKSDLIEHNIISEKIDEPSKDMEFSKMEKDVAYIEGKKTEPEKDSIDIDSKIKEKKD